jgi:hypothetical protein
MKKALILLSMCLAAVVLMAMAFTAIQPRPFTPDRYGVIYNQSEIDFLLAIGIEGYNPRVGYMHILLSDLEELVGQEAEIRLQNLEWEGTIDPCPEVTLLGVTTLDFEVNCSRGAFISAENQHEETQASDGPYRLVSNWWVIEVLRTAGILDNYQS